MDPHRPVTAVVAETRPKDDLVVAIPEIDVVCSNAYHGWYHMPNFSEEALKDSIIAHAVQWMERYPHKPFIHSEWGAGAVAGLHNLPAETFTEDYQSKIVKIHFDAFSELWKNYRKLETESMS